MSYVANTDKKINLNTSECKTRKKIMTGNIHEHCVPNSILIFKKNTYT
jgi:hypothetical protein